MKTILKMVLGLALVLFSVVTQAAEPSVYYIHNDHLGTPRTVTDSNNQVVWRWEGEPFGNTQPDEDPGKTGKPFQLNLRFPGQSYDAETGRHYNYWRDYDPETGRYVQSDPIGLGGGVNTYAYVGGEPTQHTDPRGLLAALLPVVCGGGGCQAALTAIMTVGGAVLGNNILSDWVDHPDAAKEHDAYKERSLEPPPPNLDECERLKWLLKREQDVIQGMQNWDIKWSPTGRHAEAIRQRMNGIEKLKKRIKQVCKDC